MPVPISGNGGLFIEVFSKPRQSSPVVYPYNLTASSTQVIGPNRGRIGLLFANASLSVNVYLCPAIDGNGNPLAAGGAGSVILAPGQWISQGIESPSGSAWNAAAASGTAPFTVWEYLG
jgi:hypothetical protein